jgi:nucleoid DNA-binding protein
MKDKIEDNVDILFKKMIKDTIASEGYFKEKDIKQLMTNILKELEPIIAKHVKKHFYEIGNYVVKENEPKINVTQTEKTGDKKDAKTS